MAAEIDLDEVRSLLEQAVERLDEIAYEVLRDAVHRGETKRPEFERRVTRARNAALRAVSMLRDVPSEDEQEFNG